jgi:hypothetical protein
VQLLKHYILQQLALVDDHERTNAAIVAFVWMSLEPLSGSEKASTIIEDLDSIFRTWKRMLSPEAADATILVSRLYRNGIVC